jgi:hypothetical protein
MDYYQKYLKYKHKYSQLKEMIGGALSPWNDTQMVSLFIGLDIEEKSNLGKNIKERLDNTKIIMGGDARFTAMVAADSNHPPHMTLFTLTAPKVSPFAHFLNYYFNNPKNPKQNENRKEFQDQVHGLFLTYFDNGKLQAYSAIDEYAVFVNKFIARKYNSILFPSEDIFRTNVDNFKNDIVDYLLSIFINLKSIDKSVIDSIFYQRIIASPVTTKKHVHYMCTDIDYIKKSNSVYKKVIEGRITPLVPDSLFQIDDNFSKDKFLPHVSIFGTSMPVITDELFEDFKTIFKSVGDGKPISYINLYSWNKEYSLPEYISGTTPTGRTFAAKGSLKSISISFGSFKSSIYL